MRFETREIDGKFYCFCLYSGSNVKYFEYCYEIKLQADKVCANLEIGEAVLDSQLTSIECCIFIPLQEHLDNGAVKESELCPPN